MAEIRLHPHFGLELHGIDVRRITPADVATIREKLRGSGLLVFRDQVLTDEDLVQFSATIGNGRLDQAAERVALSPVNAAISNLTNLRDEHDRPLGFGSNDTDYWHSDQEYRRNPATLASLYCLIPSPEGGDTSFASTRTHALDLPDDLLARLREMKSTRRPAARHDNVEHVEVAHPLVLRNPASGMDSLYVSELIVRFVESDGQDVMVGAREDRVLRHEILGRVLAEANIYRHRWRFGDLLVFDNTQLTHRREAFSGVRWLKATKIFAPDDQFAVPRGEVRADGRTDVPAAALTEGQPS